MAAEFPRARTLPGGYLGPTPGTLAAVTPSAGKATGSRGGAKGAGKAAAKASWARFVDALLWRCVAVARWRSPRVLSLGQLVEEDSFLFHWEQSAVLSARRPS